MTVFRKALIMTGALFGSCCCPQALAVDYEYDPLNRLTQVSYEFGARLSYTYDAAGNVTAIVAQAPTVPAWLAFPATSGGVNTFVSSSPVTVSGLGGPASISVTNGSYSINGGAFTTAPGVVSNGNTVVVRVAAGSPVGNVSTAILTLGGVSANFTVTAVPAVNQFQFAPVLHARRSTVYTSNSIVVSGISGSVPISVTGGSYSINGTAFTAVAGVVAVGSSVAVRQTSAAYGGVATTTTLDIGGVTGEFVVRTNNGLPWLLPLWP